MGKICTCLFAAPETHFSMVLDGSKSVNGTDHLIQQQKEALSEKLHSAVKSLSSSEGPTNKQATKSLCSSQHKVAAWSKLSRYHSFFVILFSALFLVYFIYLDRILLL